MILLAILVLHANTQFIPAVPDKDEESNLSSNSDTIINIPRNIRVEFPGHTIGDKFRSETSSASFFNSVDSDGDGTIGKTELSKFLEQQIGGSAFDEVAEIEQEVGSMMKKMDLNEDGSLDYNKDVLTHWSALESLLTVDEVAEWVVHAVQLPEEVGSLFRQHYVTGFDFPELVDNDGLALKNEVGITKESYRKKIMRLVRAKMLGIGSPPKQVQMEAVDVESCSTIRLKWGKPLATGFPVHKYRIMRRQRGGSSHDDDEASSRSLPAPNDVNDQSSNSSTEGICAKKYDSNSNEEGKFYKQLRTTFIKAPHHFYDDSCDANKCFSGPEPSSGYSSGWKTVYDGSETEFIDSGLKRGEGYIYRIEAWNGVGKSEWTVVDTNKKWKKLGCDKRDRASKKSTRKVSNISTFGVMDSHDQDNRRHTHASLLYRIFTIIYSWSKFLLNVVLTLLAVNTAIMKIRRASLHSTAAKLEPAFPWMWQGINALFKTITGHDVIPYFTTYRHQSSKKHDVAIKSVGLNGYKESPVSQKQLQRTTSVTSIRPVLSSPDIIRKTQSERHIIKSPSFEAIQKLQNPYSDSRTENSISMSRDKSKLFTRNKSSVSPAYSKKQVQAQLSTSNVLEIPEDLDDRFAKLSPNDKPPDIIQRKTSPLFKLRSWKKDSEKLVSRSESVRSTTNSSQFDHENSEEDEPMPPTIDDHNVCNYCRKSFKFPKRCRHNCARCGSAFCHKHGKTSHPGFVSCKVPGDCVCNRCLNS